MTNEAFRIGEMSASELFTQIKATGISDAQATLLLGNWILETANRTKRTFNYKTAFPGVEADCAFDFTRSFEHQDWIDGESVVQAEQSAGEDGFNNRFHNIEKDIDNLSGEVAKSLLCLAELRRDLRVLLDEIRTEINLINNDIFECCKGDTPPTRPLGPFTGSILGTANTTQFVGVTKFFDKNVNVWQTADGLIMLPSISTGGLDATSNPRVKRAGAFARFVEDEPTVRSTFTNQAVTKERVVTQFGDKVLADGLTLKEAVSILPDGARFNSIDAMVDAVAEREAAALRTGGQDVAAVSSALGVGQDVATVSAAPVTRLESIPPEARAVLVAGGIDTVEKLSRASNADISNRLRAAGVQATAGDAASWTASAKTLTRINQ